LLAITEPFVPAGFADRGAHGHEIGQPCVVAQEMRVRVKHLLPLKSNGTLLGKFRRGSFRLAHIEQPAIETWFMARKAAAMPEAA
jgi:hypothetical protein